jgi:hypothetical protein
MEARELLSTLTVTSPADHGTGTLRDALGSAAPGDTIQFASSLKHRTITLLSPLTISQDVSIQGLGQDKLTISGGQNTRLFLVAGGTSIISDLTLTGGRVTAPDQGLTYAAGGAILNMGGNLTLANDTLTGNAVAYAAGLAAGGAIADVGLHSSMSLKNVTVDGDQASGLYAEGGGVLVASGAALDIQKGSVSSDVALATNVAAGGGLAVDGASTVTAKGTDFSYGLAQNTAPDAASLPPNQAGAFGGEILIYDGSQAAFTNCTFIGDQAVGSDGSDGGTAAAGGAGSGATGGAIDSQGYSLLSGSVVFTGNPPSLGVSGSDFEDNQALGGRSRSQC